MCEEYDVKDEHDAANGAYDLDSLCDGGRGQEARPTSVRVECGDIDDDGQKYMDCSAGYFCEKGASSSKPTDEHGNSPCPAGYFCLEGTTLPTACQPGSYNPVSKGKSIDDCLPCDAGHYCQKTGMNHSGPLCPEGFFCANGSSLPSNVPCPAGHYCPEGTSFPIPCPEGTYSSIKGLKDETECKLCLPNYYCPKSGQTSVIDLCWAGYFCPEGEKIPTKLCTSGFYCPKGTAVPQQCQPGSYTNVSGQTVCSLCNEGFYCSPVEQSNVTKNITPCPAGFFCPKGSSFQSKQPCPEGTFSNMTGLTSRDNCQPCPPGHYCDKIALTEPSGLCHGGYTCEMNSTLPIQHICPIGNYCPPGSGKPFPCQNGTYTTSEGSIECHVCAAGYYCLLGESDISQNRCPKGAFCPEGTKDGYEHMCPEGTYNPSIGMKTVADCLDCPAGEYCSGQGLAATSGFCSEGYFCSGRSASDTGENNSGGLCLKGNFCPRGSSEPQPCPGGRYCDKNGLGEPSGLCFAGYYCRENSTTGKTH